MHKLFSNFDHFKNSKLIFEKKIKSQQRHEQWKQWAENIIKDGSSVTYPPDYLDPSRDFLDDVLFEIKHNNETVFEGNVGEFLIGVLANKKNLTADQHFWNNLVLFLGQQQRLPLRDQLAGGARALYFRQHLKTYEQQLIDTWANSTPLAEVLFPLMASYQESAVTLPSDQLFQQWLSKNPDPILMKLFLFELISSDATAAEKKKITQQIFSHIDPEMRKDWWMNADHQKLLSRSLYSSWLAVGEGLGVSSEESMTHFAGSFVNTFKSNRFFKVRDVIKFKPLLELSEQGREFLNDCAAYVLDHQDFEDDKYLDQQWLLMLKHGLIPTDVQAQKVIEQSNILYEETPKEDVMYGRRMMFYFYKKTLDTYKTKVLIEQALDAQSQTNTEQTVARKRKM